jgi:hypothetical protein
MAKNKSREFSVRLALNDEQLDGMVGRIMTIYRLLQLGGCTEDEAKDKLREQFQEMSFGAK